jgi:hypothetical protein
VGAQRRPIVDSFYGWLVPGAEPFGELLARLPPPLRGLVLRIGALRGLVLFAASLTRPAVATVRTDPGWRTLLLARALLGRRRKLVALQFIAHPRRERGAGALVDRAWAPIDRWATHRALGAGQVLTAAEARRCAVRYDLPPSRFPHIPWPRRRQGAADLPAAGTGGVISAGRAFCDWPALFEAAAGADWPLTIVCSAADRAEVERLNRDGRATVHSELAPDGYRALLAGASVAAFPMRDAAISQGHIRLMDANDAGVATVITATASLEGYVEPGATALTVPAGDANALRAAIDALHGDPELRERIRRAAFEFSKAWTGEDYALAIGALLRGVRE